jgi:hypothetical protein
MNSGDLEKQLQESKKEAHKWWLNSGELEKLLKAARDEAHKWWLSSDRLIQEIQLLHNSMSWKLTAPIRLIIRGIYWALRVIKNAVKKSLYLAVRIILNIPLIGGVVRRTGKKLFPRTAQQLRPQINNDQNWQQSVMNSGFSVNETTSAKRYWQDVLDQVQQQEEGGHENRY